MSEDFIRREDAIEALRRAEALTRAFGYHNVIETIRDLPSAQQWIPVTERLPRLRDEKYLVSLAWGGVGVMEYKETGFHNYGSLSPVPIEVVTAWQPLPEPWKGESDG